MLKKIAVYGLVGFHLAMLTVYGFKHLLPQTWIQGIATQYVRPLFHFNFVVFAPDPPTYSLDLEWRFILNNKDTLMWTSSKDVFREAAFSSPLSEENKLWVNHRQVANYLWSFFQNGELKLPQGFEQQLGNQTHWLAEQSKNAQMNDIQFLQIRAVRTAVANHSTEFTPTITLIVK